MSLNRQAAETVNRNMNDSFRQRQVRENEGLKELRDDVRNSHFQMGNQKIDYVSTAG